VVNSLQCGGPALLWSTATGGRIIELTQAGVGDRPRTDQSAAGPAHSKELRLQQRILGGGWLRCVDAN
jgi:hypothetical protein